MDKTVDGQIEISQIENSQEHNPAMTVSRKCNRMHFARKGSDRGMASLWPI